MNPHRTLKLLFGEVGLKNTFLFREPECDPDPELTISRQIIGDYWLSFLVMEVRRQDKEDIHPIRYFVIWLLVFSVLFARNVSE